MSILHPDRFEQQVIAQPEGGGGNIVLEPELLDMVETAGVYLAVWVLVRAQVVGAVTYLYFFIDVVEEDGSLDWRLKRGHQQSMVAARVDPRNRARSETADAVAHQPLLVERL